MKKTPITEQSSKQPPQKQKLKKNATDQVNLEQEFKKDPKYKTEMCKSWIAMGFCVYGNKCRFAHGRQELFDKASTNIKYKQKPCLSFYQNGFCPYGPRCHFKHDEKRLSEIRRSYYNYLLDMQNYQENLFSLNWNGFDKDVFWCESPDINLIKSGMGISNGCQFSCGTLSTTSNDSSLINFPGRQSFSKRLRVFTEISSRKHSSSKVVLDDSFDGPDVSISIFNCQSSLVTI